ncbi:ribosome small subunit-dependent GTPase A [Gluconobacter wancherniae]|uniref:ribosome small subunit-dependent GTPase A n=1 Tax=Gluconobacter wancherniae TaxID=1307955 RepID=UPI0011BF9D82|nr:ribosome small subunit-dependent GTPase A [Gluconobacter wancherniae]MBF0853491.1 ribosome small subunit-dependent GTPase A [Gluconobacter wancherniae]GBD55766.1 putative ribosome biogenesis GTPase RsgA 2 [Gluconobacter wancherniae NBRC 103581]
MYLRSGPSQISGHADKNHFALKENFLTLLTSYGWNEETASAFQEYAGSEMLVGRVVAQQRGLLGVITETGLLQADSAGRLLHTSNPLDRPAIGDWVVCLPRLDEQRATIHAVLPRATCFVRKEVGKRTQLQVIAANIDVAYLVMTMGSDFNLSRLERYLALTKESRAKPVIVLTKADLCDDITPIVSAVRDCAPSIDLQIVSSPKGLGLQEIASYLDGHRTGVMVGSSGAGKSTLLNALLKTEHAATGAVSAHGGQGRHTTTHRELVCLPSGGLLIDTPGMRELGMVNASEGLAAAFGDFALEVEALAQDCRFRNCQHESEPGCAVRAACEDGRLDERRWNNWVKMTREISLQQQKGDPAMQREARREQLRLNRLSRKSKRNT